MKDEVTVKFNDEEEFLDELFFRPPDATRIVRLTKQFRSRELPFRDVSVVATFIRPVPMFDVVELVKLERYCGQIWDSHQDEVTKRVIGKAEEVMNVIEQAAKKANLEVRAGIYE